MRYPAADLVWSHPRACPCRPASAGSLHDRPGSPLRQPEGRPRILPPLRAGREQGAAAGEGRRRLRPSALCRRGRTARSGRRSPSAGRSGAQPLDLVRASKRLRCRPQRPAQTVDVEQPAVPRGKHHAASSAAHRRRPCLVALAPATAERLAVRCAGPCRPPKHDPSRLQAIGAGEAHRRHSCIGHEPACRFGGERSRSATG